MKKAFDFRLLANDILKYIYQIVLIMHIIIDVFAGEAMALLLDTIIRTYRSMEVRTVMNAAEPVQCMNYRKVETNQTTISSWTNGRPNYMKLLVGRGHGQNILRVKNLHYELSFYYNIF